MGGWYATTRKSRGAWDGVGSGLGLGRRADWAGRVHEVRGGVLAGLNCLSQMVVDR